MPHSIECKKLLSPSKYFDDILLEKRLNSYKVRLFSTYQIIRVKWKSWDGNRHNVHSPQILIPTSSLHQFGGSNFCQPQTSVPIEKLLTFPELLDLN